MANDWEMIFQKMNRIAVWMKVRQERPKSSFRYFFQRLSWNLRLKVSTGLLIRSDNVFSGTELDTWPACGDSLMKAVIFALSVLAAVPPVFAGGGACIRIHYFNPERVAKLESIQKLIQTLELTRFQQVFTGAEKPNWNDYNSLVQLIENLQKPELRMYSAVEGNYLKALNKSLQENIAAQLKLKMSDEGNKANYQKFLDFHLAYFQLIKKVNDLLKAPVLPEADLSKLQSDHQMIAEAEALVKSIEAKAETAIALAGHENYEAYKAYASAFNEVSQKLLKLTESELVVAMHRPSRARFWIPIAGFQNQRITGSSNGSMYGDTPTPNGRDRAESNMTGSNLDSYFLKSPRFKPNYAEARPQAESTEFRPNQGAEGYGDDLWIFKKDRVENRTTFTTTDSLGVGWGMSGKLTGLQDMAIPWKFRSLMIPYAQPLSYPGANAFSPYYSKPADFKMDVPMSASSYFEAQVWGPLHIDDVKAFHFKRVVPDKKFYDLLVSKGIEVWDERTWPAKRYSGEESR